MIQIPETLTDRAELQKKISEGSRILYDVAKAAYGPKAGNVMLGFKHGAPMLSRDGVTNISQVRHEDPITDDVIQAIRQVSEKNNRKVGDGTTAVTILSHHLIEAAQRMEGQRINPMEIAKRLKEAEQIALKYIDELKIPLGKKIKLEDIATVAAGDAELGQMIADIMAEVGKDGGVLIEPYEGLGIHNEIIDGFYFGKGYKDTELINDPSMNQSSHKDVAILVSSQNFDTEVDIAPLLQTTANAGIKELVIVGEVNNAALQVCKLLKSTAKMMVVPVDPAYVAGGRTLFLEDLALMLGSEVYNGVNYDPALHLGQAQEVLINEWSTTILGGDRDEDLLKARIKSLQEQVVELPGQQSIQFAKDRLARLTGRMAKIQVGGAIEFERDEVKLRVQDAVCAVQSAMKDGIVPGGGVTLAHISGTQFDDAFRQPFRQLIENAGLNADKYLAQIEDQDPWLGFNLREDNPELTNLLEAGVIDASLVVKEIITNAVSIASGLITASAAVAYKEKQ